MPQHLWHFSGHAGRRRYCEVCNQIQHWRKQATGRSAWEPECSSICPGDDEDGGQRQRLVRPKPLEDA